MSETKYLYGAAVQGIQGFIFQTNELKDIVGASELVERICTKTFDKFKGNGDIVVNAAGNVKCIYADKTECEYAVKFFPKTVLEAAPGITISQAVVTMKADGSDFSVAIDELERRLHIQRNKPLRSMTYGNMAVMRSRKTGLPAVMAVKDKDEADGIDFLDEATIAKREFSIPDDPKYTTLALSKKSFGNKDLDYHYIALNIGDLTGNNDWIAVIHADGNGLGQIVASKNKNKTDLKEFSDKLCQATEEAAQQTYDDIIKSPDYEPRGKVVPFRPVVLGGDDMTIICRADIAMSYATYFIRHFEENTRAMLGDKDALTACAGIAYMKSSYPFHYGYRLAEALCEEAKKDAKQKEHLRKDGKAPSCIMFHKIQGSYIDSFSQIERDELTIDDFHSLKFGPYYLDPIDGRWTIRQLRDNVARLLDKEHDGNSAKNDIRQWLTLMSDNPEYAYQMEGRVNKVASPFNRGTFNIATTLKDRDGINVYPAYDMLQLLTVENQITKDDDEKH